MVIDYEYTCQLCRKCRSEIMEYFRGLLLSGYVSPINLTKTKSTYAYN